MSEQRWKTYRVRELKSRSKHERQEARREAIRNVKGNAIKISKGNLYGNTVQQETAWNVLENEHQDGTKK